MFVITSRQTAMAQTNCPVNALLTLWPGIFNKAQSETLTKFDLAVKMVKVNQG